MKASTVGMLGLSPERTRRAGEKEGGEREPFAPEKKAAVRMS